MAESGCVVDEPQVESRVCTVGDPLGAHSMALFGDSHAYMWAPALDEIGKRLHWKVEVLSKSACFPGMASIYSTTRKVAYLECDAWRQSAIDRLNDLQPDVLILSTMGYSLGPQGQPLPLESWQAALSTTLRLVTIPDDRRVVLADTPLPKIGTPPTLIVGPACLAAHPTDLQFCSSPEEVAVPSGYHQFSHAAADQVHGRYIDSTPWFCTDTVCPATIGRMNVYVHDGHVSATYTRYLSGVVQSELAGAMGIGGVDAAAYPSPASAALGLTP